MLRLENQYPAPPWYAPKLEMAQTKRRELRLTTMTSMVKLAMIVLMPRLDRRFFFITPFAHFTRLIVSSHFQFFPFFLRAALHLVSSNQNMSQVLPVKD